MGMGMGIATGMGMSMGVRIEWINIVLQTKDLPSRVPAFDFTLL